MKIRSVGDGRVVLIAGGGKCYTDVAARFVASDRDLESIILSKHSPQIVRNIIESGHLAATEFDFFIFGVEGYSRVTEVQLVRKRMASFMISSGRSHIGQRQYEVAVPKCTRGFEYTYKGTTKKVEDWMDEGEHIYNTMLEQGIAEQDARYYKLQATTFKGIIGMNAHALMDWFSIRCCHRAQVEIRHMAHQMLMLCKQHSPNLFAKAGPNCYRLGYCPENELQCEHRRGHVPTHKDVIFMLKEQERESECE